MGSVIRRYVVYAVIIAFIVLIIYLMVGGPESAVDNYDVLTAKNKDSKIGFDKRKRYFTVAADGTITMTSGYSSEAEQEKTEEKAEEVTKAQTDELNPQWDINGRYVLLNESKHMYQFKQDQYSGVSISNTDVATGGCGWCSLTSAYNILKGADLTPENFHTEFDPSLWGKKSMSWSAPKALADEIPGIAYDGGYTCDPDHVTDADTEGCMKILERLRDLQKEGKKAVCVLSVNGGMFNGGGGHIILCYKADDNGFYIINSVYMNKIGLEYENEPSHCYPYGIAEGSTKYAMKCAWILMEGD